MSCQEPINYMSEKIASSEIIGQACSRCLSWQWRIITSYDKQPRFNRYSLALETFRLFSEYRTSKVTPCNCFVLIRCCCYYNPDGVVTLTAAPFCCPLTEEAFNTVKRSWWQTPCWTVMAPYAINNSTTLLNSPPASADNDTLGGIALVPLGGNQNKDSDMRVTNFPYSLETPPPTVGGATTIIVARIEEEEEKTATGIPISLIWMPYVAFTLVILSLMVASFYKYHKKHGHKYVRRREELAKKHQQALNQINLQTPSAGTVQNQVGHHPPGVREGGDRRSRDRGRGGTLPPNGGPSSIEDGTSSRYRNHNQAQPKQPRSSTSKSSPNKAPNKQRSNTSGGTPNKTSSSSGGTGRTSNGGKGQTRNNKRHKPLTFTKNENGSMVDLRVEEKEKGGSTKMFKAPFYTHKPLSPWTVPRPGEYSTLPTTLPSPTSPLAFSDDDDDHSYLIHQTKL